MPPESTSNVLLTAEAPPHKLHRVSQRAQIARSRTFFAEGLTRTSLVVLDHTDSTVDTRRS
ncbi:BZ3500_MvSof-1268-A1-R1_Chr5-3g08249 [Microbotryum saponariae]|uniref:BZ3500_MvSof-1268-A1-R1_Chr5-3g08249 protein n=1 Tax=Microbotryum saponariae TaxID=289078 RepID=A0A2X0NR94_9BASI|nr:BZ3500_MvSof-1268-A1-R1_Chr5-3g08249 [Microbotryum saponariae]SDA08357.1 BZ3501_MvSof-1269-A2-R1_Chr5-3g07977 [Microbotryum saponariae]